MVGPDLPGLVPVRRINDSSRQDEVYLALRVSDGAEVAVRVYGQTLESERDRERFGEEVDALRALNAQPNVLSINDAGVGPTGQAYVVRDYCGAGSLRDRLAALGRYKPDEVRMIGEKLAEALDSAHGLGVYHRNIKPSNVLIDQRGEPALTDFGLFSLATSNQDFRPALPLVPRTYAAPEAFLPELMSAADDIYALGATLYTLLAGSAPQSIDPFAVAVDGNAVPDLPKVPWKLMLVLRRAMALDPLDRFADADEMREALRGAHGWWA